VLWHGGLCGAGELNVERAKENFFTFILQHATID
jgi:hypothetical protein